jgi:hypothetical protein
VGVGGGGNEERTGKKTHARATQGVRGNAIFSGNLAVHSLLLPPLAELNTDFVTPRPCRAQQNQFQNGGQHHQHHQQQQCAFPWLDLLVCLCGSSQSPSVLSPSFVGRRCGAAASWARSSVFAMCPPRRTRSHRINTTPRRNRCDLVVPCGVCCLCACVSSVCALRACALCVSTAKQLTKHPALLTPLQKQHE